MKETGKYRRLNCRCHRRCRCPPCCFLCQCWCHRLRSCQCRDALQTHTLPDDIIFNGILTRLPVKTLLRLRIVCKSWKAWLSKPHFIASHLEQARKSPCILIMPLLPSVYRSISLYRYDESSGCAPHLLFTERTQEMQTRLMRPAHANGLLLLNVQPHTLIVCNPTTREYVALPNGSHSVVTHDNGSCNARAGFGYVQRGNVYKVAQYFYRSYNRAAKSYSLGFEVFTVGSSDVLWRATVDPPYPIKLSAVVSTEGAVYFTVDNGLHSSSPKFVLSFDLEEERFEVVCPPHQLADPVLFGQCSIIQLDGSLGLTSKVNPTELDIWLRVDQTWIHRFNVNLSRISNYICPVAISDDDRLLLHTALGLEYHVGTRNEHISFELGILRGLGSYNLRKRPLNNYFNWRTKLQIFSYVESLVSVRGPNQEFH